MGRSVPPAIQHIFSLVATLNFRFVKVFFPPDLKFTRAERERWQPALAELET